MEALSNVQVCEDRSDCVELLQSAGLYLKPHARISITVTLPKLKTGQSISNMEIMEKLRLAIKPIKFSSIKVTKSSLEFVRFDAEINNKSNVESVIRKIDLKGIKLSGFTDLLKIRAAEGKVPFPTRHDWDSFFRDAKHMNEMKAGERPDTLVFRGLPIRWFSQFAGPASNRPSDQLMLRIMSQFGEVRYIDIPTNDPLRSKMSATVSGLTAASLSHKDILFTCFVQFREYIGFAKCMHEFQGKKLVYVEDDKAWSCNIEVDFDRTKHLTDYSIKKRKEERERLQALDKEKEEKLRKQKQQELAVQQQERDRENAMLQAHHEKKELKKKEKAERREKREQMRRSKKMKQLDSGEDVNLALKIASEERKLLMAQRRLESIRLLDELFDRIRVVRQRGDVSKKKEDATPEKKGKKSHERQEAKRMADQEQQLRDKLVTSLKQRQEAVIGHHQRHLTKAQMGQFRLSSVVPKDAIDTLSSISSRSIDGRSDSSQSSSDSDTEDKAEVNQTNQAVMSGPPPMGPGLMGPVPGMPPPGPMPGPPGFMPNWGPPPHMQMPPQPFPPQGPPPTDGQPPNYPSFYQPFPPNGPPIGEGGGPPPGPMCGPEGPPPNFGMPFFDGPPPEAGLARGGNDRDLVVGRGLRDLDQGLVQDPGSGVDLADDRAAGPVADPDLAALKVGSPNLDHARRAVKTNPKRMTLNLHQ
ncbi:hypothetical protein HAZT_HAZT007539 [Hyalella azteca]|uniref:RRM domain-containing protein n=1 Tax=Hyalella azteca TaxID=294128 RepID=A0A6A0H646_HYAAZ|nr:hypothetical protein HAZT_HAZT007539 [Hyalella azteca]